MKKIIIAIVILSLLFAFSFILQSKFSTAITGNTGDVEVLFLKQINLLNTSFRFMDLLTASIVSCSSLAFFILIFVLLNRNRMERRERVKANLIPQYQTLILDALEDKHIDKEEMNRFKKIIRGRFKRTVFVSEIVDVGAMLPKNKLKVLKKLYFDLGLINYTERKIKSRKWHVIIQGMKELSFLDIKDYNDIVIKHINSKNNTLRMEAQIAMVKLSNDLNPFIFLSKLKYKFSLWEQITLHQLMVANNMNVPDFGEWVLLENQSVSMFCLRMIREYKQVQNINKLGTILYTENAKLRNLAIQVIGDLKLDVLSSTLKKRFKHETYENSLEIVKTLGKISDTKTIRFLEIVVDTKEDTQLQIEAVKAISDMGEIGKERLVKMMNSDYKNYSIIIKHVLDNRIN